MKSTHRARGLGTGSWNQGVLGHGPNCWVHRPWPQLLGTRKPWVKLGDGPTGAPKARAMRPSSQRCEVVLSCRGGEKRHRAMDRMSAQFNMGRRRMWSFQRGLCVNCMNVVVPTLHHQGKMKGFTTLTSQAKLLSR